MVVGEGQGKKDQLIVFLEMLQQEHCRIILNLEGEVKYLRDQNSILLNKIIGKEIRVKAAEGQDPIVTYVPLKDRIREKEKESRIEWEKREREEVE